ncbi:MAG: adenosylmethionine decarboxylase [Candidatus Nealsonbacteria bacterium]|nr:adenosylmethionine decarboxylase [Candidatus Nealsonbacteria bacterium]
MTKKTKRSIQWVKEKQISKHAGIHLLAEFWNGKIIENSKEIENILIIAAKKAKNVPLKIAIHKFQPQGITGVVLLAESHLAIHAWPEWNYVAIDIFTCGGKTFPYKALDYLKKKFQPTKVKIKEIKRGILL